MALMGHGLAWLPTSLVADDLREGRLVRAATPDLDIDVDIHLFRSEPSASTVANRFWSRLAKGRDATGNDPP